MMKALAPRMPWGWLSIALATALVPPAAAQPAKPAAAKGNDEAAAKKDEPAKKDEDGDEKDEAATEKPNATTEVFVDSRAKDMMENKYPNLYRPPRPADHAAVKQMAAGQANVDRDLITRFVEGMANQLTNHTNIKALIDPESGLRVNSPVFRELQVATDNLIDPIQTARATDNTTFLNAYNKVLFEKLPALLNNHLLARIEAAIVLGQTGDSRPESVPVLLKQLADPKQTIWVKGWMIRGLTNAANARQSLAADPPRAMAAAKAVADFLEQEKDIPWPVQYRALEALGALRQANTARPARGQPEMASAAIKVLADPDARLELRAEAAWALGMMQVSGSIGKYNYPLIAYNVGDVVARIGAEIGQRYNSNPARADYLTGLLLYQVAQALEGTATARDSGLLRQNHPNHAQARSYIKQVDDLFQAVAKAAVSLSPNRTSKRQAPAYLKELEARVAALRAFLDKNPPPGDQLVPPDGPHYPVKASGSVAEAPAPAPSPATRPAPARVAGAPKP